jgi:PRC-barrel domain
MDTVGLGDVRAWPGLDVFDREGERVGRLTGIYVEGDSGHPEFGLVRTGLFGLRSVLVPLSGAFEESGALIVDLDKDAIKAAPHLRRDEPLSDEAEVQLYEHYGLDHDGAGQRLELWALEHADPPASD